MWLYVLFLRLKRVFFLMIFLPVPVHTLFFLVSQLHIKGAKNSDANDAGENKRGEFFPYVFFLLPSTLLKYKTMQPILFLTNVHSKFHFVSMWLYLPLLDLTERESGGSTA